jgi:hypothetical protein
MASSARSIQRDFPDATRRLNQAAAFEGQADGSERPKVVYAEGRLSVAKANCRPQKLLEAGIELDVRPL